MTNKTYTNSELFSLVNKIFREQGCTRSEAYKIAKNQLESTNSKKFDLAKALSGAKVMTKSGKTAKVICKTGNKILVAITYKISYLSREIKYNLDGSRWSPNYADEEDLVMA